MTACAPYIASRQANVVEHVDKLRQEKEYSQALQVIAYVSKGHAQYAYLQEQIPQIENEAATLLWEMDNQLQGYIRKEEWSKAIELAKDARRKIPAGETLDEMLAYLDKKQQQELDRIDAMFAIEQAHYLVKAVPLARERAETDPENYDYEEDAEKLNAQARNVAEKLTALAREALDDGRLNVARWRVTQAQELEKTEERAALLEQIRQAEMVIVQKHQATKAQDDERQRKSHYQRIEAYYQAGNLLEANREFYALSEKEREIEETRLLGLELENTIRYRVQLLLTEANNYYKRGQFELAIQRWKEVLQYQPDNKDAQEYIIRAEKAIEKLNELREKQAE